MKGHFIVGLAAGAMIGAAASMMSMPQMDWKTRRKMTRTGRRIINRATGLVEDVRDYVR